MTDRPPREDDVTFAARCWAMRRELDETKRRLVSAALAEKLGDDALIEDWADRLYRPLESMKPRDLALMVVIALADEAEAQAAREWSALHTMRPNDVRLSDGGVA